jgi:hypothetical protein
MRNDEVDDQLKTNHLTSTIMIDSGNLMFIGFFIAVIGGPTLYLLICLIIYCQTPTVDDSQPNFELNTHVGCSDGLFYPQCFSTDIMISCWNVLATFQPFVLWEPLQNHIEGRQRDHCNLLEIMLHILRRITKVDRCGRLWKG